ncbi:MAG: OB-fold nucleic acid binding domain-containing protein [Actinomycetaceae bacterium]|nr:OB-fold nucleic acid binding domain-containing protein [Actinomycetaceae bacterium]
MASKNWFQKLFSRQGSASIRESFEAADEQALAQTRSTTNIGDLHERQVARISGGIQSITLPSPSAPGPFMATLFDGTGAIDVLWLGRRSIPGIEVGVHMIVKGTVGRHGGGLCMLNPEYQLIDEGE